MASSPQQPPTPRQVAVALEGRSSPLPKIVASGYGEVARQILDIAFANGIRVREDADLATILAALDIGDEVPLEALHTVSELLARVYAANGQQPTTQTEQQTLPLVSPTAPTLGSSESNKQTLANKTTDPTDNSSASSANSSK